MTPTIPLSSDQNFNFEILRPRPTIIAGNGYDGSLEELLHTFGFAALARGLQLFGV
ncbi:hypothetical protein BX600DRAFT_473881 [Xylariales sp. PMI_506]|nr:hypothetical protein BX600DRAFT_473881 [Xylariales sp. PMI_506]